MGLRSLNRGEVMAVGKKKSAKKAAKSKATAKQKKARAAESKAAAAVNAARTGNAEPSTWTRPAGCPEFAEGRRVVGETGDKTMWVTEDSEGNRFHASK